MKRQHLITIFFLLVVAGRAAGQTCTPAGGTGPADQTVCAGSEITDIKYTMTGATSVTSCTLPAGLSYSFTAPEITITGTPTATGPYSLTLSDGTGSCTSTGNITVSPQPAANAGGSSDLCETGSVTVAGASATGTVLWTSDGAGTLTEETTVAPTYTAAAGDIGHTVTLTMTVTSAPCTPATATYTINVRPAPTASAGGSQTICDNETATVSGASATNGTILWTSSGSGTLTNTTTLTPTYDPAPSDAGTAVTLTLTVTNAPCTNATATYTVNVAGSPAASAGGSKTICEDATATVSGASASNGTILWISSGGGTLSNQTTLTPTYDPVHADAGTSVILTMTVSNGTCADATATYTVNVISLPTLSTVTQPTDACVGSTTLIRLEGLVANTEFTVNYKIHTTAQTPATVTSNGSGIAEIETRSLTGTDDGRTLEVTSIATTGTVCSSSFTGKTTTLTVDQLPTLNDVDQVSSVCAGEAATFRVAGLIAGTTSTIYYTVDGGTVQTATAIDGDSDGDADFTSIPLVAGNNGKTLRVTGIMNTGWESGCYKSIANESTVMAVSNIAPNVSGPASVCANVPQTYTTDILAPATYTWSITGTGNIINSGQGTSSVIVTWQNAGTISVTCTKSSCTGSSTPLIVDVNPVPASSITGDNVVYQNSPATYSTTGGMLSYQWQVTGGSPGTSDGSSISVTWITNATHEVRLRYTTTDGCLTSWTTRPVSVRPAVSNVHIDYLDGSPQIGGTGMRVDYTYTDGGTGSDASTYQWFRGATPISTNRTYVPVAADFNQVLSCRVTPVSTVGALSGTPGIAFSDPVEDLSHPEILPLADQVCIDGLRTEGSTLRGKYRYTYPYKPEGASVFNWIRRDSSNGIEVVLPVHTVEYTLVAEDLKPNMEIYFEVIPKSSNFIPITGAAKRSKPLAKIIGLDDRYGISEPPITLYSNVTGGYFSGPGIYGNKFMPDSAGVGAWQINHFRFYEYASHTCSQRSPQSVTVDQVAAVFSPINARYCGTDPQFVVTVSNIPVGAYNQAFYLTDPNGIVWFDATSVTIDPGLIGAGTQTLYYSYNVDIIIPMPIGLPRIIRLYFKIDKSFYLDKVSQAIKLLGLADSYCENDEEKYINVENVFPLGGTGHWTGTILKSQDVVSAYVDPSMGTAGNEYTITYQYESLRGCFSPVLNEKVKINHLPVTEFSIDPTYNIEGPEDKLIPVQPGGIFSGKGISGYLFLPSVAGEGTHSITYTVRDGNNCVDSLKHTTEVRAAKGTINGITDVVCYDNITLNLSVTGLPATGVVNPTGFRNTRNTLPTIAGITTALYRVPAAGEGNDTIYFSYKWDGLDYSIWRVVNIDSLGTAEIYNLEQDQMICDDVPPFELTVSKPGGVFSGPVVGGYFDASKATTADIVKYTFTNSKTGCSIDTSYYVRVNKAPKVDFIPYDVCIEHDKDTLRFMNKTVTADPVVKWEWKFYNGASYPDSVASETEAGFPYMTGGLKKVALRAETDKGCVVEKEKTFDIGRRPDADFYWKKDCYHPAENQVLDQLQLFDATSYTTQPKSWSWRLNGTEFGTSNNAVHLKSDTGIMRIEYIVRTDYYLCHDTAVKDIYIRPAVNVTADGYFENFESGRRGWVIGDTAKIWAFGLPNGTLINSAASGQHAWYTANVGDGSSMIESPCFDLREMKRPVIKIHMRKDFDKDRDGAVLQYRLGDNPDWRSVGTIDDGIEWYNSATINGKPGGNSLGWTTSGASDDDYKEAIHILDELKGKKDVRFRVMYGSSGTYSDHDGISFDDVFIGERSRQVLVEHFTSYNSAESMNYKAIVDTIAEHKEGDVINIQYHTNLSGTDSLYVHNPGEINARILFYGLTRVPYTFVDGGTNDNFNMLYDYRTARIDSNTITKRTLVNSCFRLFLNPVVSGRVLTVKGHLKAVENANINNLTLFIAVTEKKNKGDFAGVPQNIEFLNVFRKFIPDASGILLKTNWVAGDSITLPEKTWTIEKVLNTSDIEIIAFLQSADGKEVYQAFSVIKPDIMVGMENPLGKEGKFSLWPNPASNMITIGFEGPIRTETLVRIYNIQGEIVREYRAGTGSTKLTIEDPALKGGIYLVRVSAGNFDIGYKKLIITGD